jgi:hypothetical protein
VEDLVLRGWVVRADDDADGTVLGVAGLVNLGWYRMRMAELSLPSEVEFMVAWSHVGGFEA